MSDGHRGPPGGGERPAPPGTARAIALVTRFTFRRWLNRWTSGGWRVARSVGPAAADAPRRAVGGKSNGGLMALVVAGAVLFGLQVVVQTTAVAIRVASFVGSDDAILVGDAAAECLAWADAHPERPAEPEWNESRSDYLRGCLERDFRERKVPGAVVRADRAVEEYAADGRGAFRTLPNFLSLWFETGRWPAMDRSTPVFRILTLLVFVGVALSVLGTVDARQLEEDLAWLYQMPVGAPALLAAKAIALCLLQPAAWVVGGPMFFSLARMYGHGTAANAFGAWAALQMGAIAGSVELVVPIALGRVLRPSTARGALGTLALVGSVSVVGAVAASRGAPSAMMHAPRWLALLPGACLVAVVNPAASAGWMRLVAAAWTIGPPIAATLVGGRLVARGLVVSPGETSTRRPGLVSAAGARSPGAISRWLSRGIAGKELRWVLRDRRAFVMAFVFPGLMFVPQLLFQAGLATAVTSDVRRAAATGFGLASYGFVFSATGVVASEGGALWLVFTFPRSLQRMLLDKVTLWSCVGLGYVALLTFAGVLHERSLSELPLHFFVAAGAVIVFAFIAAGLGALATDPLATARRPLGVGLAYLYMSFVGAMGYCLFTESLYARAVSLAFFSLLALALWQKVGNRIPYLLDPTSRPPATLDVSDAILIVFAFFLVQMLVALALWPLDLGLSARISVAFFVAGVVVVGGAFGILRRAKVPGLLAAIGMGRVAAPGRLALAVVAAPVLGLALGSAARLYGRIVVPVFAQGKSPDALAHALAAGDATWFIVVAVLCAPLFEETIFRGFLYRSLRRGWPAWAAMCASAGAFAACHPPLAVAPVFVLGVVAAGLVEWSGSIVPSMVLHMTYNAVVLSTLWERAVGRS